MKHKRVVFVLVLLVVVAEVALMGYNIHHKEMENLVEASDLDNPDTIYGYCETEKEAVGEMDSYDNITVYFEEVEVAGYDYGNGTIACVQIEYPGKDAEYHERINGSIRRETVDFIASDAVCLKQFEFWYKEPMDWCLEYYILGNQYLSIKYRVQNHLTRFNDATWEYMCFVFDLETGELVLIDDLVSLDEGTIDIFAESVYPEYYRKLMGTEFVRYALSDRLRDSTLLYSEYLEREGTAIFKGSFVLEKYGIRLTPGVNGDGSGGITFLIPYDAVRQAAVNEKFKRCLENVPEPGEEIIEPLDNRPSQKG